MKLHFWEIAEVVAAKNDWQKWPDFELTGVEFDTRKITENNLFVPLQGARDGHEFIEAAKENGAGGTLWSESVPVLTDTFPTLVVADVLQALQDLSHYYLKKMQPKVVGITGSNGKTTTKDMTASVLSQVFKTHKTQGNYNNHIGLPYTILQMPDETEMLVLEMGMDHRGEIELLSQIAEPDVAVITMIGESHIEHLGSRAGIAEAKMEIVTGLKMEGLLVVPESEPLLKGATKALKQKVLTFGEQPKSDVVVEIVEEQPANTSFSVSLFGEEVFTIPVLGKYNTQNAAIALIIGDYYQLSVAQMKAGLLGLELTQNRTQWLTAENGAAILSDVYNANPTAMSLVLDTFAKVEQSRKKIAVLGDMLELGEYSKTLHESISEHLFPESIQDVYLYGTEMAVLKEKLLLKYSPEQIHYYLKPQKAELIGEIVANLQPEDMIILKGSNGMGLEEIVKRLMKKD